MTVSGEEQGASGEKQDRRPCSISLPAPWLAPFCGCTALGIAFWGLSQLDLPIIRYVRSVTIHLPWDQLTIPWMAFTSDWGDWIGGGSQLLVVSAAFLAIGWIFSKAILKQAGIETLVAHGIAAVSGNVLKHVLGRPRPKFMHSGGWPFAPSWESGLDSFPSGHTTASFAIATVLAKRFPGGAVIFLAVATFVAVSRVFRGAHFPTDVVGGAVLGILSGSLASAPIKEWRASLREGLYYAALGAVAVFSLLWTLSRPAEGGAEGKILLGLGFAVTAIGTWMRVGRWVGHDSESSGRQNRASKVLVAYGLACFTTSPLIMASVGSAGLAFWFHETTSVRGYGPTSRAHLVMREGALALGLLFVLAIIIEGRGVLPFR